MKTAALVLLLASAPALACDWFATKKVDSMTDVQMCMVTSPSAELTFYIRGNDQPNIVTSSAYREPSITVRVDDNAPIRMGRSSTDRQAAMAALLSQIRTGTRIRARIEDYPSFREGDAAICDLPDLLASCTK